MITTWIAARITGLWGRIAFAAGAVVAIGLIALRLIGAGRDQERARQERERADALKKRQEVDREVDGLGHADLDRRMSRWVRKDER